MTSLKVSSPLKIREWSRPKRPRRGRNKDIDADHLLTRSSAKNTDEVSISFYCHVCTYMNEYYKIMA